MKERTFYLNTILAFLLTIILIAAMLVRTFLPDFIIPRMDFCNMVLISLAALLVEHYVVPGGKRCYFCIPVLSGITFGLLPYCAAFATSGEALKLAVFGCVVFTTVTWLFTSIIDRLSTGPAAKLAPLVSALGLYLASQCFTGM